MGQTRSPEEIENGICDAIASFGPPRGEVTRSAVLEDLDKNVRTVGQAIDMALSKVHQVEAAT